MTSKNADEIPVFLVHNEKRVKCRICKHNIETGRRYKKSNEKYIYRPNYFKPIALNPKMDKKGVFHQHFIHSECSHISFGDLRRAKAEGKSVNELLGNVVVVNE